ncbi:conserved Plasmodium protein, unknown function [Plasmodium berghei]|uniref:Tetratricopeptide repeat protein n=2 Tax=Plasmodium berghei TaxID=5821 RepID=A0A509AJS4_PLABA|nr:conserved Plasmodium protein, unknown function [Plasmodium berghei ANKA]CXI24905.1 conserved Plasmodium protein, unknown function [Plasmodium berghei]VUC55036.1 conserved Plasmodium protein, unknown function [Plasmodium berghei ANKA]|eukprot:XP_034420855.1 conserved Plasmodium protein, unknown function [Plasmodium berghei ANKA]
MEYKEKPEGPFIVSFYITNFTSSDDSFGYTIKLTDFYNNSYESNIITKNDLRNINFSSNYIEIDENNAINDVVEKSINLDIFVNNNDNLICIGQENIKLFPFLHDQLTITKDVIISYKYHEKSLGQISQYNEENKNSEKEDDIQDEERKKKKKKKKNSSKNKITKQDQLLTQNIDARFCITLNINTLIGEYAGRLNHNIMSMHVEGVFNVHNLEEKFSKKNSFSFQIVFLDLCLNDGKLVKDEESDQYKIIWNQNNIYKYRNIKETEYIYNFLLYETFHINAYLLCFNDGKRRNASSTSASVVEDLSGKFEVNVTDLISNKVINTKYKLQFLENSKKTKDEDEKKNDKPFIFANSYLLLTIQFYKPFLKRKLIETPLNLDCFKNLTIKNEKDVVDKKNENISDLFNNYILNGIELINTEIDKLGKNEHIKLYQMSKEYFNFLNNLKENEKYINLYNNIKHIMIQIMYELINKNIYKNFNLNDYTSFKEEQLEESMTANKEKKYIIQEKVQDSDHENNSIDCKSYILDENTNYIYTQLFNIMSESCNVIINNYFEKREDINNSSIKEIKNKNNIKDIEKYLFAIFCENEFLLKNKKNEKFAEAILIILFKKIYSFYDYKKNDMEILENHKYNHIINIIENISGEDLNGINKSPQSIDQSYIYNKIEEKEKKTYFSNNTNDIKGLILSIYTKNKSKNNSNSYLIDYIENYEHVQKNNDQDIHTKGESKKYENNGKHEDIISIFNLKQNKEITNLFTYIIYKYSKILLITNNINQFGKQNNEQEQQINYTEYCIQNERNTFITPNCASNNLEYNDCFEYHSNYDSYQKYIQPQKIQSAILSLSTYIQLTNFENIESILMLSLLYLNTHKYDESIQIANYLIEILKKNKSEDKTKDEMDMKSLYLHSSFNYNEICMSKEICIYIKALCYFFQHNYIYFYINMNIILNTNENVIQKEIEKNSNFFKNENLKKTSNAYVYDNSNDLNELNEINLQKDEKTDKKSIKKKKNGDKDDCNMEKKKTNGNDKDQTDDTFKRLEQDNENVDNKNEYNSKNSLRALNDIEKENEKKLSKKKEENLSVVKKITTINCSEVNINDIPLKDKFMILFLIYCLKFNILNIVMYIYENNKFFLTNATLKTSLYRQLIIRLFFSLKDFTKCIKIIDETKEYNNNLDILYIYAESLYKLKDYKKSITYLKEYLDLCAYDNIRAKIYIQLSKLYICLNQYEDSKSMIKNSLQINKTSYAYLYFSYYYFKKKKYIYAYKLLYKSNEINIFNHKIWASLSIILLHLNMKNEADKCLNNFIKMKKYKKETIMEIIEAYKELGYETSEKQLLNFLSQQINENCRE